MYCTYSSRQVRERRGRKEKKRKEKRKVVAVCTYCTLPYLTLHHEPIARALYIPAAQAGLLLCIEYYWTHAK